MAALSYGESSGYDLAKSFDVTVANYWTATPQQLYRELDRMAADGLLRARVVEQSKRPNKRLFSLTDEGRTALREFTIRTPKPTAIRDELLVQVEAMDLGDAGSVAANVEAQRDASTAKLERYEKRREHFLAGRTQEEYLAQEQSLGSYFTLARGIAFEQETVRWCTFVLESLAKRAAS